MITKEDLLELAHDLEISNCEMLMDKLLESTFCDLDMLYGILDDSLNETEFIENFCKEVIIETNTTEIYSKIQKVLAETSLSVDDIVEYVLNCEAETQFSVILDMLYLTNEKVPIPAQETGELIYYKLIDIQEYVDSLCYMYGDAANR